MGFRTLTVGNMLEGFIDNMSEEQIDEELKLFRKIAGELKGKRHTNKYDELGVLIDEDYMVDNNVMTIFERTYGYRPYLEKNKASGSAFIYFKNIDEAERAVTLMEE